MIHAYDEYYLPRIQRRLAELFELAVVYKKIDINTFAEKFVSSGMSDSFYTNEFKYTHGKSPIELLAIILNEEPKDISVFASATPEYWVGNVYAYVSWYYSIKYEELFNAFPPSELILCYFPYHEMDIRKTVELFDKRLKIESKLKIIREKKNYSQNDLSIISNVPLRTIRSYEQKSNDIAKAQVETIYKLAKALDCNIEDLL